MRKSKSEMNHDIEYIYTDIMKSIIKSGGVPIGVFQTEIKNYLDLCNGFVLEGGSEFSKEDFNTIKIIKEHNKPLLGICLGMQEMAYLYNGIIKDIDNHMNINHEININKESLLYKIIGKNKIIVNSRHKSAITKTDLTISAYSSDNTPEAVEDKNNKFFLGLEWHPENLYDTCEDAKKIFDYFIKVCQDK